ncbi:class I adenylate-forming enzyme family protein [Haloarcula nitratireducens]|uniref:AMP-binding protein n=1 Tax=Haloarcula nitratireducens TaxID=2487749 RepID=A0AAW4P8H5_9EURY|nr:AMP-binding protein [Halomicroarcula nitratireducens]MBX0294225.1 AMP-binding protein [Halomicroarcula nitratireducens]
MREPVEWPTRDLLTHRAGTTPERTAVVDADGGGTTTYRELDAAVDEVAAALEALDTPNGRVATLVDTRPAVGRLLFGAMRRGLTLAPLNVELDAETLSTQLQALDADTLVCERDTEELATEIADRPVVSVDAPDGGGVERSLSDEAVEDGGTAEPVELDRDATQLVLFTSGTTSDPKGVRLTVGNLVASATASAFRLGVSPGDRWLVCLPTYHMGGIAPFVRCVLYGAAVVVQREFAVGATARAVDERGVTGVSLVPTMLKRLVDAGWNPAGTLRFVLLGGGPVPPSLVERCRERDIPVCPTYGMTEAASQIATARPETAFEHRDTVGQPLVCTDVKVVADGDPVGPGVRGELVVDGPTVTPGYLDEAATDAAFGPHGLQTGDLGYRDEDGRLWVVGRADDRIVTGGENVDAAAVEAVIRQCPGVEEAAVVGLPDEEWGERVTALVAGDASPESVLEYCRDELAPHEVPKRVRVTDALPRTASGTVDRAAVRAAMRN